MKRKEGFAGQTDYVVPGSDEHAAILGLVKAQEGETLVVDGWTLSDPMGFGAVATEKYLLRKLRSCVNELHGEQPEMQSTDPRKPGYAPKMWLPSEGPVRGQV